MMASIITPQGFIVAMILFMVTIPIGKSHAQNLKSLISLSKDINSSSNLPRSRGNVNIIEVGDDSNIFSKSKQIQLCHMPYLATFSKDSIASNIHGYYEGLAAIMLALEHLNTGNGTIVSDIDGIGQRCPLRFSTESFDAQAQEAISVDHIISMTDRKKKHLAPCAILSATESDISIPTSIISGIRDIPQISAFSTSSALDNKEQYKLFGRTIPNDDGTSSALLAKLSSWNVNHIAILHLNNQYGNTFADGLRAAAETESPNLNIVTVNINPDADDRGIANAIGQLKGTQYRFFFAILSGQEFIDKVMIEAYNEKIAGTGLHNWIFSDSLGSTVTSRSFPIGTPLEVTYRGTGILKATGGSSELGIISYDKLTLALQELRNEKDLSFIIDHLPKDAPEMKPVNYSEIMSSETFLSKPGFLAPFLYDAVVGIGLAACDLTATMDYFNGEELFQSFVQRSFEGASGTIVLDEATGTRTPQSAMFSLSNFVTKYSPNGMVQFEKVQTDLFRSGRLFNLDNWTFNNGAQSIPSDLPALEINPNHLSTGVQVVGLLLCGIIFGLSVIFGCWTYRNRNLKAVRASQPIFLYLIASGTLIMGTAIIPITIDHGDTDQQGANAACMSFPWLLTVGFTLTFSALFTKTYRINRIMKNAKKCKRIKLTPLDVMKPMFALLALNIVVLSVWTAIDPLQRETILVAQDVFSRDIETYSRCNSGSFFIFLSILCVINLGSLLISVIQAYHARNISTELSESTYIFRALWMFLYVSFLAIPILVIVQDTGDAFYFTMVGFIFVICSSLDLLIFLPKIRATRKRDSVEPAANRWLAKPNKPAAGCRDEEEGAEPNDDDVGIQIVGTAANSDLHQENRRLNRLVDTLSARLGIDPNSSLNNDAVRIPAIEEGRIEWHSNNPP